jgi:hypothetical protein
MGTTQRIIPGVTGEPNWGEVSRGVTSVAGTISKEEQESEKAQPNLKRQQKLETRRRVQVNAAVERLLRAAGGRTAVKQGNSRSVGRAGIQVARRLTTIFSAVSTGGLASAISTANSPLANLGGLTVEQIVQRVIVLCSDTSTGMDETAAMAACNHVMLQLAEQALTPQELEASIQQVVATDQVEFLLCEYFGFYIFEHLSQRFQEKIAQVRGQPLATATFNEIKLDIIGRIHVMAATRPISRINWQGVQGNKIIEDIFDSVMAIFLP